MTRISIIVAIVSVLGLSCSDKQRMPCDNSSEICEPGFTCIDDLCLPCLTDAECATDPFYGAGSSCSEGLCCTVGEQDCGCRSNDTCDWTLTCDDNLCVTCPPGEKGCPCDAGSCLDNTACMNGVCADPSCVPGTSNCPCDAAGECEEGRECSPEGFCANCIAGNRGCPCLGDGTCLDSLTCQSGLCTDCQAGLKDCACLAGDACEDTSLSCLDGYCRLIERLCADLDCAALGRLCEGEPYAECTACDSASGYVPDGADNCIFEPDACRSTADCQAGEYCIRLGINSAAFCALPPDCTNLDVSAGSSGSAWDPGREDCITCPACDGVVGSTGRIWPTTTDLGSCLCETQDGYYFDASISISLPAVCDADGDGWVQYPARQFIESTDMALSENARCQVNRIDSFTLQNERGEQRFVSFADMSIPYQTIGLYESVLTDDQTRLEGDRFMPAYGGRKFLAAELNPLTKACVSTDADFNGNRIPDIQENARSSSIESWMNAFWRMGYFVELHTGQFIPAGAPETAGSYLIAEKPRCNPNFSLGYLDDWGEYWRECSRRRASDFDANLDAAGFDLATWSCPGMLGSCPIGESVSLTDGTVDPATGRVIDATVEPSTGIPLHPSCSVDAPADPLANWTGMNHHSQFQCVVFLNTLSSPAVSHERDISDLSSPGMYDANLCQVEAALEPAADGSRPVQASCQVMETSAQLESGDVGWAAALYKDHVLEEDYTRGCINECRPFIDLCPTYHADSLQNMAGCEPDQTSFGELLCNACPDSGQLCETLNPGVCAAGRIGCISDVQVCESIIPVDLNRPDPIDGIEDSNCDGFDGDAAAGVFVSLTGDDGNEGTPAWPKQTLQHAVDFAGQRAIDEGRQITVYLDSGLGTYTYTLYSPLVLADGVSILGGYICSDHPDYELYCPAGLSWCRPALSELSVIQINASPGIEAFDIAQSTILEYLDVTVTIDSDGQDGNGNGYSAYGLRALGSQGLVLRHVEIHVGNGAKGDEHGGHNGAAPSGIIGVIGIAGYEDQHGPDLPGPIGGDGGSGCGSRCGDTNAVFCTGGKGGNAGHMESVPDNYGLPGLPGLDSNIAGSGGAGLGGQRIPPYEGPWSPLAIHVGNPGDGGDPGRVGTPGRLGFGSSGYSPLAGTDGSRGGHGGGGGGGAGGGGGGPGDLDPNSWGGSGAGGGGGGCGGLPGIGGGAGGASIGIYLWDSKAEIDNCLINTANGGAGGDGSAGQPGGLGGLGKHLNDDPGDTRGNPYGGSGEQDDASNGAAGGDGGKGGDGGAGAGGPGGSTIGVFRGGNSTTTIVETSINIGQVGSNGESDDPAGSVVIPAIAEEEYDD